MSPGDTVQPIAGETEIWTALAVEPCDTTIRDSAGHEWTRHRMWWDGPDGAQLTSVQLGAREPLTVVSIHEHEEWITIRSADGTLDVSICTSCGIHRKVS